MKLNSSAAVTVKYCEVLHCARVDLTLLFGSHWRTIHTSYPHLPLLRRLILLCEKSTALCCLYSLLADRYLEGKSELLWMNKVLQGEIRLQVTGTLLFCVSQHRLHMQPWHPSSAIALSWGVSLVTPCMLVRMYSKIPCWPHTRRSTSVFGD